jgi:hypothetical protein
VDDKKMSGMCVLTSNAEVINKCWCAMTGYQT